MDGIGTDRRRMRFRDDDRTRRMQVRRVPRNPEPSRLRSPLFSNRVSKSTHTFDLDFDDITIA